MTISINESELDFKLESEKNLQEVLNSLLQWVEAQGHQLQGLSVNGAPLLADNREDWQDNPIALIERIDLCTISRAEVRLQYLQALYQFFLLLQSSLEEKNEALLRQISSTYPAIREKLFHLFPASDSEGQQSFAEKMDAFLAESDILETGRIPEGSESLVELVLQLNTIISELIREITNPLAELRSTTKLLGQTVSKIEEVSVNLQTGKDREAMDCIIGFTELSQKLLRIYPNLQHHGIIDVRTERVMDKPFEDFYREFNTILMELIDAFRANDSVLLGDLLEYEVAPRVEKLTQFLYHIDRGKVKR